MGLGKIAAAWSSPGTPSVFLPPTWKERRKNTMVMIHGRDDSSTGVSLFFVSLSKCIFKRLELQHKQNDKKVIALSLNDI